MQKVPDLQLCIQGVCVLMHMMASYPHGSTEVASKVQPVSATGIELRLPL